MTRFSSFQFLGICGLVILKWHVFVLKVSHTKCNQISKVSITRSQIVFEILLLMRIFCLIPTGPGRERGHLTMVRPVAVDREENLMNQTTSRVAFICTMPPTKVSAFLLILSEVILMSEMCSDWNKEIRSQAADIAGVTAWCSKSAKAEKCWTSTKI